MNHLRIDDGGRSHFTAVMRSFVCLLAVGGMLLSGCALFQSKPPPSNASVPPATPQTQPVAKVSHDKIVVTPESVLVGSVVRVNDSLRIAVLNYPVGSLPALGQRLNVYRRGLKVGELKVTGPQQDDNIVGEITSGEAQAGDELRSN